LRRRNSNSGPALMARLREEPPLKLRANRRSVCLIRPAHRLRFTTPCEPSDLR
jgi:hypothetical protein